MNDWLCPHGNNNGMIAVAACGCERPTSVCSVCLHPVGGEHHDWCEAKPKSEGVNLIAYNRFRWAVRFDHKGGVTRTLEQMWQPEGGGQEIWLAVPEVVVS